jgi:hypothetical protein
MPMILRALLPSSPLASVLTDVNRCIDAKLYYPALLVALTLPEICSALKLDNSVFVKQEHYVPFVDKYTTPAALGCDGLMCYRLRGGIVHRANLAGHNKIGADNIIFTVPESNQWIQGISIVIKNEDGSDNKKAPYFDLKTFCGTLVEAVFAWYEDNQNDPKVKENMENLIRYCPNGLPPYFPQGPVVASGS